MPVGSVNGTMKGMSEPPEGPALPVGSPLGDRVEYVDAAWSNATRIAQAAHSLSDLVGLVSWSTDPLVRYEAMPRLRARFANSSATFSALEAAARDPLPLVRSAALMALADLGSPEAADVLAAHLADPEAEVRLEAAEGLRLLSDSRAPDDAAIEALTILVHGDCGCC